jgi:hypothetical protein
VSEDRSYAGTQQLASAASEFNQLDFIVRSIMGRNATATLVIVKAVTNDGEVSPVGLIDVQPMVAQLDGKGKATPHGIIHNVPYLRVQGGANAIIIDPKVGDIGIAVFASHDISSVKVNKAPANPGSRRRFDYADALYLGGVLNGTPEQYIRFKSDGDIEIKPNAKLFVLGDVEIQGDTKITGDVDIDGEAHAAGEISSDTDVIADGISGKNHTHGGVTTGGGDTGPPA